MSVVACGKGRNGSCASEWEGETKSSNVAPVCKEKEEKKVEYQEENGIEVREGSREVEKDHMGRVFGIHVKKTAYSRVCERKKE